MGACGGSITDRHGITVSLARERRLYVLGATLCLALTTCSRHFSERGSPYFMALLTVAGIVYLLAIRELFANASYHRRVVIVGLLAAAACQIAFLIQPAGADDDIHRYVWDGRLQRLGYNPYFVIPSDPNAQGLHTGETRTLNNPDLPSLYPPGAQLFFRAVTAIHESTFALKVAFFLSNVVIVLVLLDLLRYRRQPAHLILVYAWNPLLAVEGSSHIDIVGALLLLLSVAALLRRWRATAAVTLGLAVAVKFLPLVLLPLYWKRIRIRDAIVAAAVVGLLYVPFLHHGRIPFGSLGHYLKSFRFNGPMFAILHQVASASLLAWLAVLVGLATAVWLRRSVPEFATDQFAWPMAASLLFAPVVFPWYLLWLLPFLTSPSTLLIILWTVSIIPVYVMWHLREIEGSWGALPNWVMVVEYGFLVMAAVTIALRRNTGSAVRLDKAK